MTSARIAQLRPKNRENGEMYVSAKSDYALRALMTLAVEGRPDDR